MFKRKQFCSLISGQMQPGQSLQPAQPSPRCAQCGHPHCAHGWWARRQHPFRTLWSLNSWSLSSCHTPASFPCCYLAGSGLGFARSWGAFWLNTVKLCTAGLTEGCSITPVLLHGLLRASTHTAQQNLPNAKTFAWPWKCDALKNV